MGKDKGKQQLPTTPPPPPAAEISAMPREETDAETLARLNTQHGILEGKLNELLKQSALSGLAEIVASAVAEGQRKTEETIDSLVAQVSAQSASIDSRFAGVARAVQALKDERRATEQELRAFLG